jgi:exosortase E/protease (VPEID-CTERM system)
VLLKERAWWAFILGHGSELLQAGVAAAAALALVSGRQLGAALSHPGEPAGPCGRRWLFFAGHLGAYALFFASTSVLMGGAIGESRAPLLWAALWLLLGMATVGLLGLAALPLRVWLGLAARTWPGLLVGALVGPLALLAGGATQQLWLPLAGATLRLVQTLLSLAYDDVVCDYAQRVVGTSSYTVTIAPTCSGHEGMGLVAVFLAAYLWLFRRELAFPRSLLLVPLGVALAWLCNAVRIAALVAIGSSGWPEATQVGFHSQAGWLLFLAISLGLVAVSARWTRAAAPATAGPDLRLRRDPTAAYLGPFLALLVVAMLTAAFSGKGEPLYPLRLVAALVVLWLFRDSYRGLWLSWSWRAAGLGVVAFGAWLLLARLPGGSPETSPAPSGLGLAVRLLGYLLVAPLVEELAFRGYLLRRLQAVDFLQVRREQITWLAVAVSSVLFGALHGGRLLAGTAAGLLFALAFCRRCQVGDSVLAHAVANGLLAAYALVTGSWWAWS